MIEVWEKVHHGGIYRLTVHVSPAGVREAFGITGYALTRWLMSMGLQQVPA